MDFVNDVNNACDAIEERIYELNNIVREKTSSDEIILELNNIVSIVKNLKSTVNEENAYNIRNELINIQKEIDALFESAIKVK